MAALVDHTVLPAETRPDELRVLSDLLAGGGDVSLVSATGERYVLGAELREVLAVAARALGEGQAVSVEPRRTMLSTQQAADILAVSRPTLIKLMESGEITFTKPGRHRRVALADVLAYQQRVTQGRRAILDQMTAEAAGDDAYHLLSGFTETR